MACHFYLFLPLLVNFEVVSSLAWPPSVNSNYDPFYSKHQMELPLCCINNGTSFLQLTVSQLVSLALHWHADLFNFLYCPQPV